jgi:hypothetical protein
MGARLCREPPPQFFARAPEMLSRASAMNVSSFPIMFYACFKRTHGDQITSFWKLPVSPAGAQGYWELKICA